MEAAATAYTRVGTKGVVHHLSDCGYDVLQIDVGIGANSTETADRVKRQRFYPTSGTIELKALRLVLRWLIMPDSAQLELASLLD
jgi:hypothetical protein